MKATPVKGAGRLMVGMMCKMIADMPPDDVGEFVDKMIAVMISVRLGEDTPPEVMAVVAPMLQVLDQLPPDFDLMELHYGAQPRADQLAEGQRGGAAPGGQPVGEIDVGSGVA